MDMIEATTVKRPRPIKSNHEDRLLHWDKILAAYKEGKRNVPETEVKNLNEEWKTDEFTISSENRMIRTNAGEFSDEIIGPEDGVTYLKEMGLQEKDPTLATDFVTGDNAVCIHDKGRKYEEILKKTENERLLKLNELSKKLNFWNTIFKYCRYIPYIKTLLSKKVNRLMCKKHYLLRDIIENVLVLANSLDNDFMADVLGKSAKSHGWKDQQERQYWMEHGNLPNTV